MTTLREFAQQYVLQRKVCIGCEGEVVDVRSKRCRDCWRLRAKYICPFPIIRYGCDNNLWKGDRVKYSALHMWIRAHKPKVNFCEICHKAPPKQLANISGEYKRDINDFQWLCVRCHVYKDGTVNNLKPMQQRGSRINIQLEGGVKWTNLINQSEIKTI